MSVETRETRRTHEYELGHSGRELRRLRTQARLVDPFTRQFLLSAGLAPGMRVLDVGSGAGDVAFLAAEIVGPEGEVIGTDRSDTAVAAARKGAVERNLGNILFRIGDPAGMAFDGRFDAVVGRYVLMFSPDPVKMLAGVARHLRPGGVVVFHEVDWTGARSHPASAIYELVHGSIVHTFQKVGTNPYMGRDIYRTFLAAGLPAPEMALCALIGGSSGESAGIDLIADLATTMAPVMEEAGVLSIAELQPETLDARIRAEVLASESIVVGRSEIGAWARLP